MFIYNTIIAVKEIQKTVKLGKQNMFIKANTET